MPAIRVGRFYPSFIGPVGPTGLLKLSRLSLKLLQELLTGSCASLNARTSENLLLGR